MFSGTAHCKCPGIFALSIVLWFQGFPFALVLCLDDSSSINWCQEAVTFHIIKFLLPTLLHERNIWKQGSYFSKLSLQSVQQKISKRCRLENWVFLHTLFLENKGKIIKINYRTMFFMSCRKLARSCKNENRPKNRYTSFLHEALQ